MLSDKEGEELGIQPSLTSLAALIWTENQIIMTLCHPNSLIYGAILKLKPRKNCLYLKNFHKKKTEFLYDYYCINYLIETDFQCLPTFCVFPEFYLKTHN